jgi:hypothetical protein
MQTSSSRALVLVSCIALATGCAMGQKKVEEGLAAEAPIDCRTAEGDIRVLENEKAHVAARIAEGVTTIVPAGLVVGLITGTAGTKMRVATGEYNEKIEARIAEIKETCELD